MLNPGDLIFVRGEFANIVDDLIKVGEYLMTREEKTQFAKEYVHVAVYIGGNTIMEAQGLRKSGRANIGDYAGNYDVGHINLTYSQRKRFLKALDAENNLPYDWPGIFWLIVKIITGYDRKYRERRRRYCSKYVGRALAQVGIFVNDETPESLALDDQVSIEKG